MLEIAIIGCGKIADAHATQIARIPNCKLVAACDSEPLMARQFCDRFGIKFALSSLDDMLSIPGLDVVHITTPPQSHFPLARKCLEADKHVYVEKPFTLHTDDAVVLLRMAVERNLLVTVGHDDQFTHVARRMRALIRSGYLGGPPVHMESHYCYTLGDTYARALLTDPAHWVRRLPGGLLHNIISHGIARIAEWIESEDPRVIAEGFVSSQLRRMGERHLIDELRVIILDGSDRTAYFTFSSQVEPCLHQFRIYGPKNGLFLDHDKEILLKLRGMPFKSYAEKFIPPVTFAAQHLANLLVNLRRFLVADFHMKSGMGHLIGMFYEAVERGTMGPIPDREILAVSRIMDSIFRQLGTQQAPTNLGGIPTD